MNKVENAEQNEKTNNGYGCWLGYSHYCLGTVEEEFKQFCRRLVTTESETLVQTAVKELQRGIREIFGVEASVSAGVPQGSFIFVGTRKTIERSGLNRDHLRKVGPEGFIIKIVERVDRRWLAIVGADPNGALYGVFHLLRSMGCGKRVQAIEGVQCSKNRLRMLNHWDNVSGDIERGYAGQSIFFKNNAVIRETERMTDYARLAASVGINGIVINNVNVHHLETELITKRYLPDIAALARVFRDYGIKIYLSINFAAPLESGGLSTADPLDLEVKQWWRNAVDRIYWYVPNFGGFLVKADSENRPGPFTYGRNHAEGANMLAEALKPHDGIVIWRCFVYDCKLDWRDRTLDRAKAAYENFKPLDGQFHDNIILQIKHGPMDFQIREPVSPLLGALEQTNVALELQITQEYTGQQQDLCYLAPMWKEVLDFDTYGKGPDSIVSRVVDGTVFNRPWGGLAGVANIGDDINWTGHPLAQANFYAFARLAWDPQLTSENIAEEWIRLTLGDDAEVIASVSAMLLKSRDIYEKYTSPLGIGWMVNPSHHYGPSVDGYEYSGWGTYHYADFRGLGVNRSVAQGTGYSGQYRSPVAEMYERLETCPEELLLFFHHVPYDYRLKSGKTVLQHIYDTHFEGVEEVRELQATWLALREKIAEPIFETTLARLNAQLKNAEEWRDVVNTYFYRKTGRRDHYGRKIIE